MKPGGLLVSIVAVFAGSSFGCDLCTIYSATQAQGEAGKGPFAGITEQFTHFGTLQVEGKEVPNGAGQYLNSSISQIFAGYNFSDRVGLQFNLPVIYRWFKRTDGQGAIETGTATGIGDVSLLGNLTIYSRQRKHSTVLVNALGGVKFPTGSTSRLKEEFNEVENPIGPPSAIHGHDLTLGTGSFDGIVGGTVFLRTGRLFLSGIMQYAIRSEGDFGYQFANDLTWAGGPGLFMLMRDNMTLSLQAGVSAEHKGLDSFQEARAADTGQTAVYLGPQLNLTWSDKLSFHLGVDLPVSIDNTALQAVPDYRLHAGMTWRF